MQCNLLLCPKEGGTTCLSDTFQSCAAVHKKAVFLVSGVLDDTAQHMLKDIITASQLQYVIVLSTVPPGVQPRRHGSVSDAHDRSAFDDLEDMLLEWMGNHVSVLQNLLNIDPL